MNSMKLQNRLDSIFMNSENSKISDPHRILLNLTDKINLKRSDKYVALTNLSNFYTWKNIKNLYKSNKLKYQLQHGMQSLNYLMDHILYQIFRITLNTSLKNMKQLLIIPQ